MGFLQPSEGTFEFCATCPVGINCCFRARELGQVEAPFALEREVGSIAARTGMNIGEFSQVHDGETGEKIRSLRSNGNQCIFYKEHRCSIYAFRPFDCRIFPFDIFENSDGSFYWILYLDLCPREFSIPARYQSHFESAKRVLLQMRLSKTELHEFASYGNAMKQHRYKILERVVLAGDG